MQNQKKCLLILVAISLTSIMIASCAQSDSVSEKSKKQLNNLAGPESSSTTMFAVAGQASLEDMILFEGNVFVASTKPVVSRWQLAGWEIARNGNSIAGDQVPPDCTLYPHEGVEDQWIGSCTGSTYVPTDGANHIAVMHTDLDGSTELIQVAPTK